ncbi:MAG: hypothetical protein NMNS02_21580 [Nitrosomonas sp.]|nr:MAG: hypothetical protein NMNS02_21580 [Nitrosomonas sp.]
MIILLGLELATGNFALIPIAVKDKRTRMSLMIYNWTWVLLGNLIGGVAYAFLYYIVTTQMGNSDPATIPAAQRVIDIAETKTIGYAQYGLDGTVTAFTSALLSNWMVTLGIVMAFSSTTTNG